MPPVWNKTRTSDFASTRLDMQAMMAEECIDDPIAHPSEDDVRSMRRRVHRELIEAIENEGADVLDDPEEVRQRIKQILDEVANEQAHSVSPDARQRVALDVIAELTGAGPLAPLMLYPSISDILINGPKEVWVDRFGQLERSSVQFDDEPHRRRIVDRMVSAHGRRLDAASPMVDARLHDGSRLHAIIPPLCPRGTIVSIRRFAVKPFASEDLVSMGFLSEAMLTLLQLLVVARVNIVVSGSAATGKTTLLNTLSRFVPATERIVTIEETAELRFEHPHVIPLESRTSNAEGRGAVTLRGLVKNALRMRADRIVVGEVRGDEVFDMLQAMNVGHDGSLTTVHANSPEDVLSRLESLVMASDISMSANAVRRMIGSSIDVIVHLVRFRDGSRRIVSIRDVLFKEDRWQTEEIFRFQSAGLNADGEIMGEHVTVSSGATILSRIEQQGFDISPLQTALSQAARQKATPADASVGSSHNG